MRKVILQKNISARTAHIRRVTRETLIHTGQATVALNVTFVIPVGRDLSTTPKRNITY